jgi:hypothetical protein
VGEIGYSRRNLGLAGSAKNASSPANLAVILRWPPRLKIGADNRRFREMEASGSTTLASRDAIAKTPPFGEEISCPAVIMGEYCDSGHGPGLDGKAERGEV